ncbi:sulfatase [Negadavirga shengliensis]|uniref:Sulfatase n=1 Tax=Negadavirga shengliensis TaxID=1389218 RepID=A0ABV9SWI3_9BACT
MKKARIRLGLFCFGFLAMMMHGWCQEGLPNMVMIIADDIGWDDMGCYGNQVVKTPNMDRMALEGVRFDNFYLTTSSCSPSRTSIISGRYPHNTGAAELHTPLPESILTFTQVLKEGGYFTAQSGKWHMGPAARNSFDLIYDKREEIGDGGEDKWLATLQERPKEKPFFLWLAALDAHRPWGPNDFSGMHDPEAIQVPVYLADAPDTRSDLAKYYDEIARFDYFVGKVEEELEAQGVLDNTVIFILSDNGRPFPRSKTRMYDSGIKSPLIVKWPKGITEAGAVSTSMVSSVDLAPTFLDLAGLDIAGDFQGKSFLSVIEKPDLPFRKYVFAEHNWHDHEAYERMVRTDHYMYVLNLRPSLSNTGPADSNASPSYRDLKRLRDKGRLNAAQADVFMQPRPFEEFYHCERDGEQLLNQASLKKYENELDHLRQVLAQWRAETHDTAPQNLTYDWYDKETGQALDVEQRRGDMPGGDAAMTTKAKGPF